MWKDIWVYILNYCPFKFIRKHLKMCYDKFISCHTAFQTHSDAYAQGRADETIHRPLRHNMFTCWPPASPPPCLWTHCPLSLATIHNPRTPSLGCHHDNQMAAAPPCQFLLVQCWCGTLWSHAELLNQGTLNHCNCICSGRPIASGCITRDWCH